MHSPEGRCHFLLKLGTRRLSGTATWRFPLMLCFPILAPETYVTILGVWSSLILSLTKKAHKTALPHQSKILCINLDSSASEDGLLS